MRKVVLCNTPLSHVEKAKERKWYRYNVNVSSKAVSDAIFCLVQLTEYYIGSEMKTTRGALMFDGWSANRVHYVAVYA